MLIEDSKLYLVEHRLLPIAHQHGLSGIVELIGIIERGRSPAIAEEVAEAMTINETYFFRDRTPFEIFKTRLLPRIASARDQAKLRLWSAAFSTGQEPYSLAMILDESSVLLSNRETEIIATDLSRSALAKASAGKYSQFEVQRGLAAPQISRYFSQRDGAWQIADKIRSRVGFRRLNLLSAYEDLGLFDVIFCRNVLIYFSATRKADILGRMARSLTPGGRIIIGASENIVGLDTRLEADPESGVNYVLRRLR